MNSIDIKAEPITSTSKGIVSTTWSPIDGASRQQQIQEARIQAHADYQKQLKEAEPYTARLLELEKSVAKLQAQVKLLQKG